MFGETIIELLIFRIVELRNSRIERRSIMALIIAYTTFFKNGAYNLA